MVRKSFRLSDSGKHHQGCVRRSATSGGLLASLLLNLLPEQCNLILQWSASSLQPGALALNRL